MADMRSILSFLNRLWSGWRARRPLSNPVTAPVVVDVSPDARGELVDVIEPPPSPSANDPSPAVEISPPELGPDDDRVPEEDELEETDEEPEDDLTLDPFIAEARPPPANLSTENLEQRRSLALAEAQIGEHKIPLSALAGPGTLAEALNRLLQEGRVTAEFRDDADDEPHIVYRQKP